MKKKNKNLFFKIIGGSSILSIAFAMVILICVLMIFDFFVTKITKEKVQANAEYADAYTQTVNKYLKDGYVPLQRLLYFNTFRSVFGSNGFYPYFSIIFLSRRKFTVSPNVTVTH